METDSPLVLDTTSVDSHAVKGMRAWVTAFGAVTIGLEPSPRVSNGVAGHVPLDQGEIEVGLRLYS